MDALKVDGWLRKAAQAVFSPRCLLCGESGAEGRDLCRACAEALPWNDSACLRCALPLSAPGTCGACLQRPPPRAETHAVFVYGFPLDRLVPRFKFHNDLAAGRLLSELMLQGVSGLPRPSALVPVPLHDSRALQVPLLSEALVRTRATAPQSELDAGARQRNLRRAFEVRVGAALPDHVTLIDDVMTTGATLEAAAKRLRRAGVARVDAWVCARVP
jgi:ComF family protein